MRWLPTWLPCNSLAYLVSLLPMQAAIQPACGVGRAFSRVCLSVCPHSKRKMAWAIYTKHGTHILYSSCSACIDPEVKGQGRTVTKTVTVARLLVMRAATAVCCCCRRGSAWRCDCLCYLVAFIVFNKQRVAARWQPWWSVDSYHNCLQSFLANVNSRSRSLYAISRPSVVCLSVCDVGAPYSGGWTFRQFFFTIR